MKLSELQGGIDGIRLPGGTDSLRVVQFADDTNLFLSNIDYLYAVFELFDRYESASGARLKPSKTRGIAVNHPAGKHLCSEMLIKWNELDTKFLDVIFTPDLVKLSRLNWARILDSAKRRVDFLLVRNLSLRGRAQVLNAFVLSKAWHVGRTFLPDLKCLRNLIKLCFQYIWSKSHEPVRRETMLLPLDKGGVNLLPILKQCVALQVSDLLHMCTVDEPPWCEFAKYWIGDRVKGLLPEWRGFANNNRPKHVIGPKPQHFEILLPYVKKALNGLDGKTPTIKAIRRVLW